MEQERIANGNTLKRLQDLVIAHNLFHVTTLCYNDMQGVLAWLRVPPTEFTLQHDADTVTGLKRFIEEHQLRNVEVIDISEQPQILGKDRLVVFTRQDHQTCSEGGDYDSVLLFLVFQCTTTAPHSQQLSSLVSETETILNTTTPIFPAYAKCTPEKLKDVAQQNDPVIDSFVPSKYETTTPRLAAVNTVDNFGRKYEPIPCHASSHPWTMYSNIATSRDTPCEFDIEKLISTPCAVLGRGGFGLTVEINDKLVAKTNLFPERIDWSLPFINNEFDRYAHIASQMEEVMIGASMRHPNILHTLGGFWCEIPGYQLGGRAVIVMEKALCTLHEFRRRVPNTSIVPAVELDTLRGLDYLRSKALQHRDLTSRNVLVCHQPGRKPLPITFKISDFGRSCNFSTPDHPAGNLTNMAPETLWCREATIGSDIFSWYCVMWELHSGSPLVNYQDNHRYCKKTYAENLSSLLGVYNPEKAETFELSYMKVFDARSLHSKHKDARPSVESILGSLTNLGSNISDKNFVSMGVLCITLFPQERSPPSELLALPRYQLLSTDIADAPLPCGQLPLSVGVGEYKPTDVIFSHGCIPEQVLEEVTGKGTAATPCQVIRSDSKTYYGLDIMRLAPGLIQPYDWYLGKANALERLYKSKYSKRKSVNTDKSSEASEAKRRVREPYAREDNVLPGVSSTHGPHVKDSTQTLDRKGELLSVQPPETHSVSLGCRPSVLEESERSKDSMEILRPSDVEDQTLNRFKSSAVRNLDTRKGQAGPESGTSTQENEITARFKNINEKTTAVVPEAVDQPQNRIKIHERKVEGELSTTLVFFKSGNDAEIKRFKEKVVILSQNITREHPLIFEGPREELCRCSGHSGLLVFECARLFANAKQVSHWTLSDSPHSAEAFLLQMFLTLKTALDVKLLPIHMTYWRDIIVGNGAVMIQILPYLARHFNVDTIFGEHCNSLGRFCISMAQKHLPNSNLLTRLNTLSSESSASDVLSNAIECLSSNPRRTCPSLLTLHGNSFTLKDYFAHSSNWVNHKDEEQDSCSTISARLLVYGHPVPLRGDQTALGMSDTMIHRLVRNIVVRLRVKFFGDTRVQVTSLNCTQGLLQVTLNNSALSGISGLDELHQSRDSIRYTHDAVSQTESKWCPVIMFTRVQKRQGPLKELTISFYKMKILIVLLSPQGPVTDITELFKSFQSLTVTEF